MLKIFFWLPLLTLKSHLNSFVHLNSFSFEGNLSFFPSCFKDPVFVLKLYSLTVIIVFFIFIQLGTRFAPSFHWFWNLSLSLILSHSLVLNSVLYQYVLLNHLTLLFISLKFPSVTVWYILENFLWCIFQST